MVRFHHHLCRLVTRTTSYVYHLKVYLDQETFTGIISIIK